MSNKLFKFQLIDSWLVNSANLMRTKCKISLSTTKNDFHLPPYFSFPHYNRPLSRGGHFVSGELKSFVYARLASFCLRGKPCVNKAFKSPETKWPPRDKSLLLSHHHHHYISIVFIHHQEIDPPAENRTCIIAFIDLKSTMKPVQRVKSPESGARPNRNKNPSHSIHKIKTEGYGVIGVTAFLRKLMNSSAKKG